MHYVSIVTKFGEYIGQFAILPIGCFIHAETEKYRYGRQSPRATDGSERAKEPLKERRSRD